LTDDVKSVVEEERRRRGGGGRGREEMRSEWKRHHLPWPVPHPVSLGEYGRWDGIGWRKEQKGGGREGRRGFG
jgi:hypothetical protein